MKIDAIKLLSDILIMKPIKSEITFTLSLKDLTLENITSAMDSFLKIMKKQLKFEDKFEIYEYLEIDENIESKDLLMNFENYTKNLKFSGKMFIKDNKLLNYPEFKGIFYLENIEVCLIFYFHMFLKFFTLQKEYKVDDDELESKLDKLKDKKSEYKTFDIFFGLKDYISLIDDGHIVDSEEFKLSMFSNLADTKNLIQLATVKHKILVKLYNIYALTDKFSDFLKTLKPSDNTLREGIDKNLMKIIVFVKCEMLVVSKIFDLFYQYYQ